MAIEFKSNVDFDRIKREILEKQERELKLAINDAATEIVTRTQGGKDSRGTSFAKYSDGYGALKQRVTGRIKPDLIGFGYRTTRNGSKNKAGTRVGSPQPGSMLAAITSEVTKLADGLLGRIFFSSQKEAEKARGNMKIRKFFELSKDQVNKIRNRLQGT
jgi:hypothetical protein